MVFHSGLLKEIRRISEPITDFVRSNPLLSSATLGISSLGIIAGATTFIRRKKRKKAAKRKTVTRRRTVRKRVKRRKKRVTHRTPRHRGHKKVTFTTKDGKRVSFLVKKPKHSHRIKRRKR